MVGKAGVFKMYNKRVMHVLSDKNILVTGGTGLFGRQIVNILVDAEAKVRVVSLDKLKPNLKAEYIYGYLTNFEFCKKITLI